MIKAVKPGSRFTDSWQTVSADQARALKKAGIDGCFRYLGACTKQEREGILAAGLGFCPVTVGNAFNGKAANVQLEALGYPEGGDVFLDMEGRVLYDKYKDRPEELVGIVNAWAHDIKSANRKPKLYVGSPQIFTGKELWELKVVGYWKGLGMCNDRFGKTTEPAYTNNGKIIGCGWGVIQAYPSVSWAGVWVDVNLVQHDYLGRSLNAEYA